MAVRKNKTATAKRTDKKLTFRLTHPDRIMYPELNITKRELADYFIAVAEWILPHVCNRPLSLVRCPSGIDGDCFFQKHPPLGLPDSVERIQVQEAQEQDTYLVIHDLPGLLALIQFGAVEIHAWGVLADDIERPNRLVFDFDPDPKIPWKRLVEGVEACRELFQELQLECFLKTTGGKGLHVVVPIDRRQKWPEVKQFSKDIADVLVSQNPQLFIATMSKAARTEKIFIDYLRNQRGATAVVPYSPRARVGATVSVCLDWKELSRLRSMPEFTLQNLPARLARLSSDPWEKIEKVRQRITEVRWKKLRSL